MSYEKVKSVSFNKKEGKVWVTSACNNCRPLTYGRWEYCKNEDFETKIINFFVDVLEGNFKLLKSCRWYEKIDSVFEMKKRLYQNTNVFFNDLDYKTSFNNEMNQYLAKTYLVPYVYQKNPEIKPDCEFESAFISRCISKWNDIKSENTKEKKYIISSALMSDVFPGYDVLIAKERKETVIAPRENYNAGILTDKENTAYFLGKNTENEWSEIAYAGQKNLEDIFIRYPQLMEISPYALGNRENRIKLASLLAGKFGCETEEINEISERIVTFYETHRPTEELKYDSSYGMEHFLNLHKEELIKAVSNINYQIMDESQKNNHDKYNPDFQKLLDGASCQEEKDYIQEIMSRYEKYKNEGYETLIGFAFNMIYITKMKCGHFEIFQSPHNNYYSTESVLKEGKNYAEKNRCSKCICNWKKK